MMNAIIKKQMSTITKLFTCFTLIMLLSSVAYGTPRLLAGGGDTDEIFMLAGETVEIEIYSDDTAMYTAFLYYEYDGGELVHDDLNSPNSEAGALAQVFDLGDPYYAYEVDAFDFTGTVSPGIHFIFEYTATESPGSYQLELYNDTFDIILDALYIFIDVSEDIYPPIPDPMTWSSEPAPINNTSITMTAAIASDASGVEYFFDCVSGGGNDSGWQDQTTYIDSGLIPGTEYTYRVKARDKSENFNETQWSTEVSVMPVSTLTGELIGWGESYSYRYSELPEGSDFVDIALAKNQGWRFGLALKTNGSIVGWGYNMEGQTDVPVGNDFVAIAAGNLHCLALKSDGSIVGWGENRDGESTPPPGNDYIAIAAGGSSYSLALKSDGRIVGWGYNASVLIEIPTENDFIAISAGRFHGLALTSDGSIVGWGNDYPEMINLPVGNDFIAVSAGNGHSLALRSDGSLVGWGSNAYGQIGVPSGNDFIAISAGDGYSLALRSNGSIVGWGDNWNYKSTPPAGSDYVVIAAGGSQSAAIFRAPIYVNDDAPGNNDGSSWENAYNYLQDALSASTSGDQIWVAQGTYTPDSNSLNPEGTGDRNTSFQLKEGVSLNGGFEGWEKRIFLAYPDMHEAILSGDLNGDDSGWANRGENSYHVINGRGTSHETVLEGFTITGGNANGGYHPANKGGGMYNNPGSPTVSNCKFYRNSAAGHRGGGMFNMNGSSPNVNNCSFIENRAGDGGGITNENNCSPTMVDCQFISNECVTGPWTPSGGSGGAINNRGASNPSIQNCTFIDNHTPQTGGAIFNQNQCNANLMNCVFNGNSAAYGGGFYNNDYSDSDIINCSFVGNTAVNKGGGLRAQSSTLTLANCIVWGNTAPLGPQIGLIANSTASISHCDVQDGQLMISQETGSMVNWDASSNIDADPIFIDADSSDLQLSYGSPCIDAGDNFAIPLDLYDLDEDGDPNEPIPFDLENNPRMIDEIFVVDTGNGIAPIVDMGSFERKVHMCVDDVSNPSGDGSPTNPFDTIQEAIDNSQDEYVIILQPGIYTGDGNRDITFDGKAITVQSTNPIDPNVVAATIIDCQGSEANPHRAFDLYLEGETNSIIDGLSITNGYHGAYNDLVGGGTAIRCLNSVPTIRNCLIYDNSNEYVGGGISCHIDSWEIPEPLAVMINNCTFRNNSAFYCGGGINVSSGIARIEGCIFEDNVSSQIGNDIGITYLGNAIVNQSTFSGDTERIDTTRWDWCVYPDQGEYNSLYGYYEDPNDPNSFQEFPVFGEFYYDPDWPYMGWFLNADSPPWISTDCPWHAWPGGSPTSPDYPVVYRWISPHEGTTLLKGYIQRSTAYADPYDSNSLEASIYVDSTQIWSIQIEGQEEIEFDIETSVVNGSTIDIVISAGESAENDEKAVVLASCYNLGEQVPGAGIYSEGTFIELRDCALDSSTESFRAYENIYIEGTVNLAPNRKFLGYQCQIQGLGTLILEPNSLLNLDYDDRNLFFVPASSTIGCTIIGSGLIQVPVGTETVFEGFSRIELTDPNGGILCEGLLRVKDHAQIVDTNVEVTRVSFEGDVDITKSTIYAEAGNPYGQFFAEDSVTISGNEIHADGDRYLDLDPAYLQNMIIANNTIYVTITEGVGNTRGGLFELRGDPNLGLALLPFDPNVYHYEFSDVNDTPEFDTQSWTIEKLELLPGAKVNLANRFDFGNGGFDEVLYVKQLVVGPDSQLNTAFNRLYYGDLIGDSSCIINVPMLGFSLNMIEFDSEPEFVSRVVHNNYIDPVNEYYRIHIIRETGEQPDPDGMMKMIFLDNISARAKGLFAKSSEQRILVWFEYLFNDPNTELAIYLSDVPELLDHNHPDRSSHYLEAARLKCPPSGRPGSPGSGRFGTFHQYVDKGTLDFIRGTRIELEFIGPEGSSIYINNWDPQVECSTEGDSVCKDVSGNTAVDTSDFLTVIGECGSAAVLLPDGINTRACLDGPFSQDGYVDAVDVISWDWITHLLLEGGLTTFCFDIPMTNETGGAVSTETYSQTNPLPLTMGPLLITGKKYSNSAYYYMQDCLYAFDEFSSYQDSSSISEGRLNGKLVSDPQGNMYQLNAELGLVNLSEETAVIAPEPNGFDIVTEPRYHQKATVYVGLYGSQEQWFGRPILDVAFAPDFDSGTGSGFVYAVPVVVKPDLADPNLVYTAAAKLQVNGPGDYTVVKIFDEPPDPNDNQYRDALREIEIDRDGNVYVINSHELNESDILWRFRPDGSIKRIDLGIPDSGRYIPAPIGMCVSDSTNMLYLASSQDYEADPNCSQIYGFSLEDLDTISRTITIYDMHHITDITEDPASGDLWVSGFNMYNVPSGVPPVTGYPFYEPYLARIPLDQNTVTAVHLDRSGYDLALPLSIIWTDSCGVADLDGNGQVGIGDLSVIADNWLRGDCDLGNHWCDGADLNKLNPVNMLDWKIFTDNWLNDCN